MSNTCVNNKVVDMRNRDKKKFLIGIAVAFIVVAVLLTVIFVGKSKDEDSEANKDDVEMVSKDQNAGDDESESVENEDSEDADVTKEDPQQSVAQEDGAKVDVEQVVSENETNETTLGIDVSKYQGTISWKQVADAGVDFAMVRVGYRTSSGGAITADSNAKYNMQEAQKHGIKVGAYFFSTAVTVEEAIEEANWVADFISKYKITYPVAFNCEGFTDSDSRQYQLSVAERTDLALAFLNRIAERGYTPMFYAAKGEMEGDAQWEVSRIQTIYKVWVAWYPSAPYPETGAASYSGVHAMWQYTNRGTVPGINSPVDVNVAYFGYDKEQEAQNSDAPEEVTADVEAGMKFEEVNETVTAKDKTNLRNIPSQSSDSTVMHTLTNGDTATRTGVSDSGWSRVIYNGNTYYAVSSYLTTDLSYTTPKQEADSGFKTKFTSVNERVTAKDEVNLRSMPSVTDANSQVVATIKNGEVVVRTGINNEQGWSRVEYNGQTLYCVSSYLMTAE